MPVVIKEMHLNIKVNYGDASASPGPAAQNVQQEQAGKDQDKMLEEYYEAVMEVINNKNER